MRTLTPMTESRDETLAAGPQTEPQVLANVPPTAAQRRIARIFLLALVIILAATWPFATVPLPEVDAFVPTIAAALFVCGCVSAAILVAQLLILRLWSLLIIAC